MTFWTYLIQCADRHLYAGHTDDLERRVGEHQVGLVSGYTRTRGPVHLVWSQEFPTRYEALQAERQIKGWSRAKKLALIRGDWSMISQLARSRQEQGRASTGSARTEFKAGRQELYLHPHPKILPTQPYSLSATLAGPASGIRIRYSLNGPTELLDIPAGTSSTRRNGLWQHTCFELFAATESGYVEFNFTPSGEWAAYRFSSYREGMADLETQPPAIRVTRADHRLDLTAELHLPNTVTRMGLSAVIEELDGTKSYWALRHPPGDTPDFHHPDCFALELPSASAT
jgi:predicted GIY-YIG superfamily endonuclease